MLVRQDGPSSPVDDMQIAEAENIALSQRMGIELQGNDHLHLGVHQSINTANWDEQALLSLQSHIQQHQSKIQAEAMMQQQAAIGGQFGPPLNSPGISPAPRPPAGNPGMGSLAGLPITS